MSKNTKIKFGKAVKANRWAPYQTHAVLVSEGELWSECATMTVFRDECPNGKGGMVDMLESYQAVINGVRLVAEVRSLGDLVQSPASARSSLKKQILEALEA